MFTKQNNSDIDSNNNWPQPPSFDRNAPIHYPRKFEPSYLMKRLRGKKITSETIIAPFKIRKNGNHVDIDLLSQIMQKKI